LTDAVVVASADPWRLACSFCRSAIAAFRSAALRVFPSCLLEASKDDGDGAAEIKESEHPVKMRIGKAKRTKAARFDGSCGAGRTNLLGPW